MAHISILDFIEGNNVNRLDVLFKVLNFFNQIIHRDLLIFNRTHDLQLVDSKAHRHQLGYNDKKKNVHSLQHPAFYQLQKYATIFI